MSDPATITEAVPAESLLGTAAEMPTPTPGIAAPSSAATDPAPAAAADQPAPGITDRKGNLAAGRQTLRLADRVSAPLRPQPLRVQPGRDFVVQGIVLTPAPSQRGDRLPPHTGHAPTGTP